MENPIINTITLITLVISIISFFLSILMIITIYKNQSLKSNITNQLVIMLTVSEIINNLTQISSSFNDKIGTREERYAERMRICYSQVYSNLFSHFFTIFSSFLISVRLYDLLIHNGTWFHSHRNVKIAKFLNVYISLFLSLIFFILQMQFMQKKQVNRYYKFNSCWVGGFVEYTVTGIFAVFIILNFWLCIRCCMVVKNFSLEITKNDSNLHSSSGPNKNVKTNKLKQVQNRLIIYPFVTTITFLLICAVRPIINFAGRYDPYAENRNEKTELICHIIFSFGNAVRGFIFSIVYLLIENTFRKEFLNLFKCKKSINVTENDINTVNLNTFQGSMLDNGEEEGENDDSI